MDHAVVAPPIFGDLVSLLVAGAVVAYVGFRLGLVPIVGFLLAGVVIGPNALALVRHAEVVDAAAEAGVILLLFTIGIEFKLAHLARLRRLILVGGGLQVLLATLATVGALALGGVDWRAGVFTGFLVALSSTAIILKLLADRGEAHDERGRIALGVLIFQDLAVIAMVLFVPVLGGAGGAGGAGGSGAEIAAALGLAVAIIAGVLLFARRLMPLVLEGVARTCSPEIFLLTVVAICFGTAYLTSLAGVSLSLGAFLAGLLVSESRFSEHALGEILPLQILFSGTFFISVGMLLDVGFLLRNLPVVLGVSAAVLAVKVVTTTASVRVLGYRLPLAAAAGLTLAQVGEFSFVLERAGRAAGLYPGGLEGVGSQTFIAATVLLMVVTPQLAQLGARIARRPGAAGGEARAAPPLADAVEEAPVALQHHVIVAGYGQGARVLVRGLERSGVPYAITTLSPHGAREAAQEGRLVRLGDATRRHVLDLAGLERARAVVIADDDPTNARRIAAVARVGNPDARIVVRTRYAADAALLEQAGADRVVAEESASAADLLRDLLASYGVPATEIDAAAIAALESVSAAAGAPQPRTAEPAMAGSNARCTHLDQVRAVQPRTLQGCEECLQSGDRWVHLRLCRTCGHVGCCDSSPNRHATEHFRTTSHPIAQSLEPGEDAAWCYVDEVAVELD